MNFSMFFLLIIFLMTVSLLFIIKSKKTTLVQRRPSSIQLKKYTQFMVVGGFLVLLIVFTIASEYIAAQKTPPVLPLIDKNNPVAGDIWDMTELMEIHEEINDTSLLKTRMHEVGDTLYIQGANSPDGSPQILIERTNSSDQVIEERLYLPQVYLGKYDLSQQFHLNLPNWSNNTMSFPVTKKTSYLVTFSDAASLSQLTKNEQHLIQADFFLVDERPLVIHLIVPEGIEIITDNEDFLTDIDEF